MPELLSVNEYARRRKITPQAVYKKVKEGRLPYVEEQRVIIRIPADATEVKPVKSK